LGQPFQPSTHAKVNAAFINVNAAFQCRLWVFCEIPVALQLLAEWALTRNKNSFSRLFHIRFTVPEIILHNIFVDGTMKEA
jgi:hypothetical protein